MPEINFESNIDQNQKLQQEFEERLNDVREKMDSLFDQLQERGISLSEYFHSNPRKLENLQKVWSSDIVGILCGELIIWNSPIKKIFWIN